MIKWYGDDNLAIFFSPKPDVVVRYPSPDLTDEENKAIKEKPFLNKKRISITLFDLKKNERYGFTAKEGYTWDGASIPCLFWRLIGSNG